MTTVSMWSGGTVKGLLLQMSGTSTVCRGGLIKREPTVGSARSMR